MSRLSHKQKLYIIVGIAAVAVVLQYLLHLKLYAQILVTLVGAIIALSMFKEWFTHSVLENMASTY